MNKQLQLQKLKSFLLKRWIIALITLILAGGTAIAGLALLNGEEAPKPVAALTQVKTMELGADNDPNAFVEAIGTVRAKSQVDIVSVAQGTLRSLNFQVGDRVQAGTVLARLYDSTVLTSLNNANTNFINTQSNLLAAERLADQSVRQAELGIQSAEEQVAAAEIGVRTALDNLKNAKNLKNKSNLDTKNSAVVSFNSYMNTIFTALDQVDSLLNINEDADPITAVYDNSLGVEKSGSVNKVLNLYRQARNAYLDLQERDINTDNITVSMEDLTAAMRSTELMVGATIDVLDNSVTSLTLSQAYLEAQKTAFISLRANVVNAHTGAKTTLQTLQNLDLFYDNDIEALENALEAAQNQLERARTGLENARNSYENAIKARDQQILASASQVDNARGQLNLAQTQAADLTISAPIGGQITKKYVDLGAEISPGTPIAQISQTEALVVDVDIAIEDANKIEAGQSARIYLDNKEYEGVVNRIDPAADNISRKVNTEIMITTPDSGMFVGTFVEIKIANKNLSGQTDFNFYIPLQVLTTTQTEKYVFVFEDGKAVKRNVEVGQTEGRLIEISSGLEPGDQLITEGAKLVEDGEKVEMING